jgi:hypothetical protein
VAAYRLDPLGIVEAEPVVLDDGTALHDLDASVQVRGASRAGVSVLAEPVPEDEQGHDLTAAALAIGPDELLIDWEAAELAGEPAVRTLVLVQLGGVATVVLEQWRLLAAGERWIVTATADLALWPRFAPGLRAAVATLEVEA